MKNRTPRVAVIGASGIGKNHARWFDLHGAEVVAFVGSSPQSVESTHKVLADGFGFSGRGYADVEEMLRAETPDIVCVSSPPSLHFAQVTSCLRAGAHMLCEKPLVYDAEKSPPELQNEANALVKMAREKDLMLGTQMQYAVAVGKLLELAGHHADGSDVREFSMEMETKNLKHGRDFDLIWIDLSPHPLSVLQKIANACDIDETTLDCQVREHETEAKFRLEPCGIDAHITVRFNPTATTPLRRFSVDGKVIDYVGRKDESGEFRTFLICDGHETQMPDFVDTLVANFLAAWHGEEELLVTGAMGAQNVAWQWQILKANSSQNAQIK